MTEHGEPLRRTALYEEHLEAGGQIVPFAGWEMPVQYKGRGLVAEHNSTRTACGLFDVSHMGEILIAGPGALDEVQHLVSNDVSKLGDGEATYALLCHDHGGTVDDLYVYRLDAERFLLVVNAANIAKDHAHMLAHAHKPELITNRSDDFAQLALQGPMASQILAKVADGEAIGLPRNHIRLHSFRAADVLVATTGYTGEPGFELYMPPEIAADLWRALTQAGTPHGISPVGLGARDTLRLEMGYALYGHELDDDTNGYEARLGWAIKLKAGDFVGRDALAEIKRNRAQRLLVGLEMIDRGIPRAGYPVLRGGETVGHVTSGTHSPSLGKPIALAMLPRDLRETGTEVHVEIRGNKRKACVRKFPFYPE
jgi:aminomethyltransferase